MRELYISDLDGTLLNSEQLLSLKSIETLNQLIEFNNLNFSIATARSFDSAWPIIKDVNFRIPIVFHNGAFIYDPLTKNYIEKNLISNNDIIDVIKNLRSFELNSIVFTYSENKGNKVLYTGIFNYGEKEYISSRLKNNDKRFNLVSNLNGITDDAITILIIDEETKVKKAYDFFQKYDHFYCHMTQDIYSKFYWLEIGDLNSNKKVAIKKLRKLLRANKIISFGDNRNDLPMFEESNESFAVANCHDDLKANCTGIIGHNNDDAVSNFIKKRLEKCI